MSNMNMEQLLLDWQELMVIYYSSQVNTLDGTITTHIDKLRAIERVILGIDPDRVLFLEGAEDYYTRDSVDIFGNFGVVDKCGASVITNEDVKEHFEYISKHRAHYTSSDMDDDVLEYLQGALWWENSSAKSRADLEEGGWENA